MSFFHDLRRGYRDGRSGAPAPPGAATFDQEDPLGFAANELAECKAVIAGLLAEKASFHREMAESKKETAKALREKAGLLREIADLKEECERASAASASNQDNAQLLVQIRELESIIAFPGARNALVKALHPDTGTGGDIPSRTAITQKLLDVFDRLGVRR